MRYDAMNALIVLLILAFLSFPWILKAQGIPNREMEIHKNVKLIVIPAPRDLPEELRIEYQHFLPVLVEELKTVTSPENSECGLTLQVAAGYKEIGTAKVKRVFARVTAYRQNSNREFVARLYLHSFATDGPVSRGEITDFLKQRILNLVKCQPKVTQSG